MRAATEVHGIWSCTKSFTSTVLGLLVDDKKCSLDTKAATIVPELKTLYPDVTLRHFTTMTSGYRAEGDDKPKSHLSPWAEHHPVRPDGTALQAWGEVCLLGLGDEPVRARAHTRSRANRSMRSSSAGSWTPIHADSKNWKWGERKGPAGVKIKVNSGSGNAGGHVQISARELARFGHLVLNEGIWDGKQLVSKEWIGQASTVQVPADVPDGFPEKQHSRLRLLRLQLVGQRRQARRQTQVAGRDRPNLSRRLGHNNNLLLIVPESSVRDRSARARSGGSQDRRWRNQRVPQADRLGDCGVKKVRVALSARARHPAGP